MRRSGEDEARCSVLVVAYHNPAYLPPLTSGEGTPKRGAGVLTPSGRMEQRATFRLCGRHRIEEGLLHPIIGHTLGHAVPEHLTGPYVDHGR